MFRSIPILTLLTGCTAACFGDVPMEGGTAEDSSSDDTSDPVSVTITSTSGPMSTSSTTTTSDEDSSTSAVDPESSSDEDGSSSTTGETVEDFALRFDGSSYAQSAPLAWSVSDFTAEAWIQIDDGAGGIIVDQQDLDNFDGWSLYLDPTTGNLTFSFFDDTHQNRFIQGPVLAKGWHHVAGTKDDTDLLLHLDGELVASATVPSAMSQAEIPTTVGNNLHDLAQGFELVGAVVDDIRISDEPRYGEDFDPQKYGEDAMTALLLTFDEGEGTLTEDVDGTEFEIEDPQWVTGYRSDS